MNGRRFRVPCPILYEDDLHHLRRGLIPLAKYSQDVLKCWSSQGGVNRFLAQRAILIEVKRARLIEGINGLASLRQFLLKHKRLARCSKKLGGKYGIQKAGKVKDVTRRLDPAVKVLAVIGGALVSCKGNHFRRRYAYREDSYDCAGVGNFVLLAEQMFAHDAEQNTVPDQFALFSNDHSGDSVRDALEVLQWESGTGGDHVMPNV